MEEGLFQLLFILLIFVAAIFDSIARSRKKRERMEEMEQEEEGAPSATEERERSRPSPARPSPEWETPRWEPGEAGEEAAATEERPEPAERETADQMVPEDLWAILTGQEAPPGRKEAPPPARREAPPPSPEESPRSGRSEPPRPTPRWEERRQDVEDALGRRSEPEPPKRPRIPEPMPGDRYRSRAEEDAREVERRPSPRRGADLGAEAAARLEDPWQHIPDISEGAIGEERPKRPQRERQRRFPGPDARARRPASRYARLLAAGDRESLREAIVLREVLDVPLARRGSFGGWEEDR